MAFLVFHGQKVGKWGEELTIRGEPASGDSAT